MDNGSTIGASSIKFTSTIMRIDEFFNLRVNIEKVYEVEGGPYEENCDRYGRSNGGFRSKAFSLF